MLLAIDAGLDAATEAGFDAAIEPCFDAATDGGFEAAFECCDYGTATFGLTGYDFGIEC